MDKEKFETFLDFGSSKIRIGAFDSEHPSNTFFNDELCVNDCRIKKFTLNDSDIKINKLVKDLEKKNQYSFK